ncbi:MAG: oligosaccharide flippase family protein [Gammaproteobacteria bacterium]|nr:oligosaccharide flippase family protein [Gammaproteobacteria bacterium]
MANQQTSQLKKTAKHSAVYGIGTALRQLTGLVMLPIYTRYLSPADYGVVELLTMTVTFVSIFIGLRISQAMFRYFVLAETPDEKNLIVSTVMHTIIATSSIGSLALYFAAEPAARILFGNSDYLYEVQLFSITIMLGAVADVGMSYIRARQLPVLFVVVGAVTLILQVTLNVIFVVILDMHVRGVVYSVLISGVVVASVLALYVFGQTGLRYSITIAGTLVRFIIPLIFASVAAFYVNFGDRYFLRIFGGLAEVGIYALAWRISSVLSTVFEAFNMSWSADQFEVVKKRNAQETFNQIFRVLAAALFLSGTGIALFASDFFRIMTAPEFYAASDAVPIMVFAIIFQVMTNFCQFGIVYKERTRHIAEANWIKALVATAGFLLIIPYLGSVGAAMAVLLAQISAFGWSYLKSKSLYDMGLTWSPVNVMGVIAISCIVIGYLLPEGEIIYFIARILIYAMLIVLFYKVPNWSESEKQFMRQSILRLAAIVKKPLLRSHS